MISYAQNAEDAVLARAFRSSTGFYVDLGAGHPVIDSVTKHFSDRGWRGMNVEPLPEEHALLCAQRPRDINVRAAVTDRAGTALLYPGPDSNRGASTLVAGLAPPADGAPLEPIEVTTTRLTDLLAEHDVPPIDFLKIDVEGGEATIIGDVDWATVRPRVVVVEATVPNSQVPSHDDWEPVLVAAGYRCALFDGLNRFYAREDDAEALSVLAVPANIFDDIEPWRWLTRVRDAETETEAARIDADAARSDGAAARTDAAAARVALEASRAEAGVLRAEAETLRSELDAALAYATALEAGRSAAERWTETVRGEVGELAAVAGAMLRRVDPGAADLRSG